jgi:hypothetical protein
VIHPPWLTLHRFLAAGALWCALAPAAARAQPPDPPPRLDGGQGPGNPSAAPPLSDEDREVIENLDLLQAMDGARDLDLLLELKDADEE